MWETFSKGSLLKLCLLMIELVFYCVRDTTNRKSMLGMKVCPLQVIGEGGKILAWYQVPTVGSW